MKKTKTYQEKLLDPRWQKRRLEIFGAFNWKCGECSASTKTLHAHHLYYERGLEPWEYPDDAFLCVCDTCHNKRHEAEITIDKIIHKAFTANEIHQLARYISANGGDQILDVLEYLNSRPELMEALAGICIGRAAQNQQLPPIDTGNWEGRPASAMSTEEGRRLFAAMRAAID